MAPQSVLDLVGRALARPPFLSWGAGQGRLFSPPACARIVGGGRAFKIGTSLLALSELGPMVGVPTDDERTATMNGHIYNRSRLS